MVKDTRVRDIKVRIRITRVSVRDTKVRDKVRDTRLGILRL